MHPSLHHELIKARIADLHREAEQARLVHAARRSRPTQAPKGSVTSNRARRLARRVVTAVAARTG